MDKMIDIFVRLGRRLENFGADERSARCIADAVRANRWFAPRDVAAAAEAVRTQYLDEGKLRRWLAAYDTGRTPRRDVAIIMAGNIPFVGFFDMMCVLLCGHAAWIKRSGKDSHTIAYITELLREICPDIPLYEYDAARRPDMAIATGGDAAAAYFASLYAGIPALIRGSRHSAAVLSGSESAEEIGGLQRDIFSYCGLGCRNVSLVWLPHGCDLPLRPPEEMGRPWRNNLAQTKALLTMNGTPFVDAGGCVAVESPTFPDAVSCIHFARYRSVTEAEEWLRRHDGEIQCVVSRCIDHPRRADFGRAQYPALSDYADGEDVMEFLTQR